MAASIDNNVVAGLLPFPRSPGAIRIMTCGNGPQMLRASLDVSNNYVFGPSNGIVLHQGAIGVSVYNNFVVSSGWAGIQCGDRITDQFDCMLSKVYRNYVIVKNPLSGNGVYFNTKLFNPGRFTGAEDGRGWGVGAAGGIRGSVHRELFASAVRGMVGSFIPPKCLAITYL